MPPAARTEVQATVRSATGQKTGPSTPGAPMATARTCSKCRRLLPLTAFHPSAVARRCYTCAECARSANRAWERTAHVSRLVAKSRRLAGAPWLGPLEYQRVLAAHGHRCFVTGARHDPTGLAGFGLVLVRAPSCANGSPAGVRDLVPVTTRQARIWEAGAMLKYVDAYLRWVAAAEQKHRSGSGEPAAAGAFTPATPTSGAGAHVSPAVAGARASALETEVAVPKPDMRPPAAEPAAAAVTCSDRRASLRADADTGAARHGERPAVRMCTMENQNDRALAFERMLRWSAAAAARATQLRRNA